jgi:hypothetical protein
MSKLLGHDAPHFTDEGMCECSCAECKGSYEHTIRMVKRGGKNVRTEALQARCICPECAHNTPAGDQ